MTIAPIRIPRSPLAHTILPPGARPLTEQDSSRQPEIDLRSVALLLGMA